VNGQDSNAEIFDVFLCHNSEDKPAVREICRTLVSEGIKPWLDEEQIQPGTTWQTALGEQIKSIKSAAVFVGNSGIGPWQDEEIQAFLGQFMKRKCPVIPTTLASAKTTPELPWTLQNRHRVDFRVSDPDPLKQLIWGITGQKPAEREPLIPGIDDLASSRRTSFEPRLRPPFARPPNQDQIVQLEILRRRVKEYWVDGVRKHSLHNEVLISLGKRPADEFVDAPWKYTVEVSDALNSAPLEDRDVKVIYDATGLLLILGEPGCGKTTTLLDLAGTLLERARIDINERIPIVVNLSNWKKKQPLAQWIAVELSEKYRVPVKIGRSWLEEGYLLPLLDGLDEVSTALQPDCVTAINAFIDEMSPSGLVVCCRLNEYRWLPKRLKLNGAICLEPLSSEEVSKYLAESGPQLAALREAVNTDPVLQELAQTPLMLSIMSLACQGADANELAAEKGDSPEERRKQIFRLYVEQMFQRRRTSSLVFPKEKTIGRLSWLARKLKGHSQSVFLVEGLQPSWLGTRAERLVYGTVMALSLGLIFGLSTLSNGLSVGLIFGLTTLVGVGLGCWSESPLKNGVMSGSIGGPIFGLINGLSNGLLYGLSDGLSNGLFIGLIGGLGIGSLNHITLVETVSWKWNRFWKRAIPGSIVGLISGLIIGLIRLIFGLRTGLSDGLTFGLVFGLISALVGGFIDRVKAGKASPNQGIKLSLQNSLAAFLVTCLTAGLTAGLAAGLIYGLSIGLSNGLIFGLVGGLIVGLNRGGSAVIKHYALRLILWLNGYTPFKFIKFLDHCAWLILLKKVGGGYIFIHRMLLEYFADIPTQHTSLKR
jgi:DNA polymerase III delta prime subunit